MAQHDGLTGHGPEFARVCHAMAELIERGFREGFPAGARWIYVDLIPSNERKLEREVAAGNVHEIAAYEESEAKELVKVDNALSAICWARSEN